MIPRVRSMIATAYVTDIDASRAFYELLGFREHSSAKAEDPAWSVMQHEGVSVLLAATGPALDIPALPLLFYFFCADIEAVAGGLEEAGVPAVRTGIRRTRSAARSRCSTRTATPCCWASGSGR